MDTFEVGDIVKPTEASGFTLASGCGWYSHAIVLSVEPFALVSEESDMLWTATVKLESFEKIGEASPKLMEKVERRRVDI